MKNKFLVLILVLTCLVSMAKQKLNNFGVELAKIRIEQMNTTLSLKLLKKNESSENYLIGVQNCPAEIRVNKKPGLSVLCLVFHTWFRAQPQVFVPVIATNMKPGAELASEMSIPDMNKNQYLEQGSEQEFAWGKLLEWHTLSKGSNHYFYLQPKDNKMYARIGPIAGSMLGVYDFSWKDLGWEFDAR